MSDPAYQYMTEEEYLRTEELSPVKREFVAGYVYPLHGATLAQAGATNNHGSICVNLILALGPQVRKQGCKIFQSDTRVKAKTPTGKQVYYYPDVVATCEAVEGKGVSVDAPCFITEVLSPGTRHTDQTDKLWAYTSLANLQVYLIVEPERRSVRVIERQAESWSERELEGEGEIDLPCLGATLTLEQVYEGVL